MKKKKRFFFWKRPSYNKEKLKVAHDVWEENAPYWRFPQLAKYVIRRKGFVIDWVATWNNFYEHEQDWREIEPKPWMFPKERPPNNFD